HPRKLTSCHESTRSPAPRGQIFSTEQARPENGGPNLPGCRGPPGGRLEPARDPWQTPQSLAPSFTPPSPLIKRTLAWSVLDGVLHAVMLGVSESYLGAFAVELGHREAALALLATLPPLCGALCQLAAPWLVGLLGNRKRLVVLGAALQGFAH